jgi:hypothetical protein
MKFEPFFEIKLIKLSTSRPKHFLGHHLQQHFCKNATSIQETPKEIS